MNLTPNDMWKVCFTNVRFCLQEILLQMGRVWEFEEQTQQYTQTSQKSVREDETKVSRYTQLLAIKM